MYNIIFHTTISRIPYKNGYKKRQFSDQKLRKLADTAGFSDIYAQDYSGYFKDIKHYIYSNGEKHHPQDISFINIFSYENLKKRSSRRSRMALLHLRKVDCIIRNVSFFWTSRFIIERNL